MNKKVLIIGGGASGMMAAIQAARNENDVVLMEGNDQLGKKILITGNGRCNITNVNVSWKNYHGSFPKFSASVLGKFSNNDTINFFEDLGLVLVEEENGRLFPRSQQAQSVVEVLESELENLNVQIRFNQKVKKIDPNGNRFTITTQKKKQFVVDNVILATGGKSYPKTGSTGDGYRIAENLGHTIIEPFRASVPLRIKNIVCNKLQGIKVNVQLKVIHNDKVVSDKDGELLFTHLGISAPVVLESSRVVSGILKKFHEPDLKCSINFFPEYSEQDLYQLIKKRMEAHPDRMIARQFVGMLPKKVSRIILQYSDIDPSLESKTTSNKVLQKVIKIFTDFQLPILDTLGWEMAQFTAGGVDVKEINSQTMESKLVPGLYFCGEVVDIDGDSGGYNLQWAWSSGFVAGSSV